MTMNWLDSSSKLESLDFSHNSFTWIRDGFKMLPKFKKLMGTYNEYFFFKINKCLLNSLTQLTYLDLSNNE
jgi:hypothetical protein